MDKIIRGLEVLVMVACVVGVIGFMYLFINVNIFKTEDEIKVGPIIKFEVEKESGDFWNYETSPENVVEVKVHSEDKQEEVENMVICRYSIIPISEGEATVTFNLVNEKTKDIKDSKIYNIKVTKFGTKGYSANIME